MTSPTGSPTAVNQKVLAVSTSGMRGSLALAVGENIVDEVEWDKRAVQSELATVKLTELLSSAGMTLRDLTHLAVNVGPGSFTGIRVGLNLVRALGYSLDLPVAPFDALSLIARREMAPNERVMVALKAIRGHWYTGVFENKDKIFTTIVAPCSVETSGLASFAQLHSARPLIEGESLTSVELPAAELIAALNSSSSGEFPARFISWNEIFPLYVRLSEAEEKLRRGNS